MVNIIIELCNNLYNNFYISITNDSECSGTTGLQQAQISPCYTSLCTGYQLQLASSSRHWCLHIEQSQAHHPATSTHYYKSTSPPEVWDLLVSNASWYHHREAQNHSPEHSRSPFLSGGMIFPPLSRTLDPCQATTKNSSLSTLLDFIEKKNSFTFSKSSSFSYSFSPFCHRWSFRSLPLSPLACLVGDTSFPGKSSTWLHRYYLNWTELDNAITKLNNEMHSADNWVLNPVILHYWHNLPILILCSALLQFVLLKALYK